MTAMLLPGPSSPLAASLRVPASKSLTNRGLIAAAAAGGGTVRNPLDCEDTRLLAEALGRAGWTVEWQDDIRIGGRRPLHGRASLWLGNSGTGARLLLGLLAASPGEWLLDGTERLRERPMAPLLDALRELGAHLDAAGQRLPATIAGASLAGGTLTVRPEVSSQFVSSLLLAAPLMRDGLELEVAGELPSQPYLELTVEVLRAFGVTVEHEPGSRWWRVPGGSLRPAELTVEGDWSAAAFFAAAAAVAGGSVAVAPLALDSRQGDRRVCEILRAAGVEVAGGHDRVVFRGPARQPLTADLTDTPDLFPALAVVAAVHPGSRLGGLHHLRHKESDRLSVMVGNLERLGCRLELAGSELRFTAPPVRWRSDPAAVTAAADHRIAMAMAVAALVAGPLQLDDPDCVAKSFPSFWGVWYDLLRPPATPGPEP